ncbi:MAG: phenylalanine--tRNA ligase subunit alpha [Thermoplasmata archaeon]
MSYELSRFEKMALLALDEAEGEAAPDELAEIGDFEQTSQVMNAVSWLHSKRLVEVRDDETRYFSLLKKSAASKDLPERTALKYLKKAGGRCTVDEIQEQTSLGKKKSGIALGWLKKKNWAKITKRSGETWLEMTKKGKKALGEKGKDEELIVRLQREGELSEDEVDIYAANKLLSRKEILKEEVCVKRTVTLTDEGYKALRGGIELKPEITQLTSEIIRTGAWEEAHIRPYDIKAFAPTKFGGKKHPLRREIEEIRRVFLEMGFTEIKYDFIQPAFWNMDALFIPQDHPARDLQDTHYLKRPARTEVDAVENVKDMHETGGNTRSRGWGYKWSYDIACRNVLRTHTTSTTIRALSENPDAPQKFFSVDRNFRSEATDSTHLSEFIQIEGVVMEEDANMNMLIGLLKEFYGKMGFDDVKVRPSYFPFTEPSLEVFAKYGDDYLEMGGAGIFREEVTAPHGIEAPVLAWGLGLERLVMLRLGIKDIREPYKNDVSLLKSYSLL